MTGLFQLMLGVPTQTLLLVGTHLLAFTGGSLLTWYVFQRAQGVPVGHTHDEDGGTPNPHPNERFRMKRPHVVAIALLILALGIVFYGFTQQRVSQADREEAARQRACFVRVVDQLTESSSARGTANARLQKAISAKSDAVDDLFDAFRAALAEANEKPGDQQASPKIRQQFEDALARQQKAKAEQIAAAKNYDKVRAENPVPPTVKKTCLTGG